MQESSQITAVREALRILALPSQDSHQPHRARYRPFQDTLNDSKQEVLLPCDVDRPRSTDVSDYIVKQMEYVQTFLVADRLGKKVKTATPLMPPGHDLTPHVRRILKTIGHAEDDKMLVRRKYYPFPHLKTETAKIPFVDFAGFVVVLLTDYVRWLADETSPVSQAARQEAEVAVEFLISEDTIIKDNAGIGWGFVPVAECAQSKRRPLPHHRHVFPTAKAVVAIQRYADSVDPDPGLLSRAKKLLPDVLTWLESLGNRRESGMYFPTDTGDPPYFADHIYATEALLALNSLKIKGSKNLAFHAMRRLLDELRTGNAVYELDRTITHRIAVESYPADLPYDNRATLATCLSTLSQGVEIYTGEAEEKIEIRKYCNQMLVTLLFERKNSASLWPRDYLQFHWTLGVVEALLRYSRNVPPKMIYTSVEKVEQAVEMLVEDEAFKDMLRRILVDKIRELGSPDVDDAGP